MKLKSLACLALLAATLIAQARASADDPISGVWKGDMGTSETARFPITMELKFDGKAAVSGSITGPPYPGEIKTGTFEPKTGALKLEVEVKGDGAATRFVFEGVVVNDAASGRVSGNNKTGDFKVTKK